MACAASYVASLTTCAMPGVARITVLRLALVRLRRTESSRTPAQRDAQSQLNPPRISVEATSIDLTQVVRYLGATLQERPMVSNQGGGGRTKRVQRTCFMYVPIVWILGATKTNHDLRRATLENI